MAPRYRRCAAVHAQDGVLAGGAEGRVQYGEQVCAWIKPKTGSTVTADEIRAFCKGQIAHYKVAYRREALH